MHECTFVWLLWQLQSQRATTGIHYMEEMLKFVINNFYVTTADQSVFDSHVIPVT